MPVSVSSELLSTVTIYVACQGASLATLLSYIVSMVNSTAQKRKRFGGDGREKAGYQLAPVLRSTPSSANASKLLTHFLPQTPQNWNAGVQWPASTCSQVLFQYREKGGLDPAIHIHLLA